MPFRLRTDATSPKRPSNEALEGSEMAEEDYTRLAATMQTILWGKLGIDGERENAGRDKKGNLRIFELQPDGTVKNPLENDALNSRKFLEKVQRGQIFAFPAGQENPVQLQVSSRDETNPEKRVTPSLKITPPMTELPLAPPPPRPNFFKRLINRVFGGYKQEINAYNDAKAAWDRGRNAVEQIKANRADILQEEVQTYDQHLKERESAKEAARLEKLKVPMEQYKGALEEKQDAIQQIYGTKPVYRPEFAGTKYMNEQFKQLKSYDLSDMNVNGPVTERQFMAVGFLAVMSPEIGGQLRQPKNGLPEGMTADRQAVGQATFYTMDLHLDQGPRDRVGDYFGAIGAARDAAADAFKAYKEQGDPQKLGEIIGKGLHNFEKYDEHPLLKEKQNVTHHGIVGYAVELLDRDPKLKEAAEKAGMTTEDLNTARADLKLMQIANKNEWAKERMEAAEAGKIPLTPEERKTCVDARVTYETLSREIANDMAERQKSEEYQQSVLNQGMKITEFEKNNRNLDPVEKQAITGAINNYEITRMAEIAGVPEIHQGLASPKADQIVEKLIDVHVPNREKLYSLDGKELEEALKPQNLFREERAQKEEPQKEHTVHREKEVHKEQEKQRDSAQAVVI